jgi:ADP-heptose:LPS heptosyltransferase
VKRLEWLAKNLLAVLIAALCWRPGRRAARQRALAPLKPGRVLLVRIDNRVGEALLTTPLIDALAAKGWVVDALVHPKVRRVLEGHPHLARIWNFEKNFKTLRALRAERFTVVVNCGNWEIESVTSAIVARLAGPHSLVLGPLKFPSGWLMDVPVAARVDTRSEARQRLHLVSSLTGELELARLSFRATAAQAQPPERPYCIINPGGRLGYRRVPSDIFAQAARAVTQLGLVPLVTWGPGEERLADEVVEAAGPQAVRAPPTDLDQLATLMRGATATICNNTGPMHLSVAVGCPTLAFFLRMEIDRWGHPFGPHRMVDLTPLIDAGRSCEALVAQAIAEVASAASRRAVTGQ